VYGYGDDGWLREYLHTLTRQLDDLKNQVGQVETKVDALSGRMAHLEFQREAGSHVRAWWRRAWSLVVATAAVVWSIYWSLTHAAGG